MLVLSRRVSEEFLIGDDIRIMVLGLGNRRVKLGITAPKGVAIMLTELIEEPAPVRPGRGSASEREAVPGRTCGRKPK